MLPDCIAELQSQMAENSINAMVILKPENSFLTSGLNTIIQSHPVIVIMVPNQDPILLVYALRHELSKAKSFLSGIRLFGNWSERKSIANTWQEALGVVFRDLTLPGKVIGFERGFVSGNRCDEVAKVLPWASLVDVSPILLTCRQIKDEDQIVNARRAGKVADIGMAQLIKSLREGATESRACIMSTHEMNLQWDENEDLDDADVCGFASLESGMHNSIAAWMMSGPRKFLNCASPIKRVPKHGETVSAVIWVPINGIWSEIERTICMGEVPEVEKKALKAIHEIRAEILPLYRPGTSSLRLSEPMRSEDMATIFLDELVTVSDLVPMRSSQSTPLPRLSCRQA